VSSVGIAGTARRRVGRAAGQRRFGRGFSALLLLGLLHFRWPAGQQADLQNARFSCIGEAFPE
jgi:hypothetical protein